MPINKQELSEDTGNWYILTVGLPRIEASLTLAPGISLRPINGSLTVFDLAAVGSVGFTEWAVLEPLCSACTCEIETALDANIAPGYDTLNRAWLASALLVLRGFTTHLSVAYSRYSWQKIAGHQKRHSNTFKKQMKKDGVDAAVFSPTEDLPKFQGGLLDYHLKITSDRQVSSSGITNEDVAWINKHFGTFNKLAWESDSFRFALEASIDWRYATDIRAAVARLWGGIESIFGLSSELTYRIALLSAALLSQRGIQRRNKFSEVKNLYGLRSKVVHGEQLSQEKLSEALRNSYYLLRDLLLLTIEKDHVLCQEDFDEVLFD